jgi:uncharacterized protein (TIGR00251 family)
MKLTETKEGTIIEVFVKPNQPKFKVAISDNEIFVFSSEQPVKDRVNKEIIKEFSKIFHSKIEFVSGLKSRRKQLLIKNMEKCEAELTLKNSQSKP